MSAKCLRGKKKYLFMFPPEIWEKTFPDISFLSSYTHGKKISPEFTKTLKTISQISGNVVKIFSNFSDISEFFLCEKCYAEMYYLTLPDICFFSRVYTWKENIFSVFKKLFSCQNTFSWKKLWNFYRNCFLTVLNTWKNTLHTGCHLRLFRFKLDVSIYCVFLWRSGAAGCSE